MNTYKQRIFPFFLIVILGILLFARYNYRHVPFERDEGEYAYAGSLLLHKHYPYQDAYNMKFPGSYMMYALLMKVGGEGIEGIRIGICFIILITGVAIMYITFLLTGNVAAAILAMVIFCALTNTMGGQGLIGNSEHFVNLFMAWGILLLLFFLQNKTRLFSLFSSGILLGCAVIMKQYGYAFCLFGLVVLVIHVHRETLFYAVKTLAVYTAGLASPVLVLLAWILSNGLFQKFYFLTFKYAFAYIGLGRGNTGKSITQIFFSAIPICILVVISLIILLASLRQSKARFLLGWVVFSIVALATGFYLRVHYFILAYPALAVTVAYTYYQLITKANVLVINMCLALALISFFIIHKEEQFAADPVAVFNNQYPYGLFAYMPQVANHIDSLITAGDKLSMFSNEPELFFYTGHVAASGYMYSYPLFEKQPYAMQMTDEFIRQVESNPSRLFVYHSGALEAGNDSTYHRFENWWKVYSEKFYLEGVFFATTATQGRFMSGAELKTNEDWKNSLRIEFWMKKN